MTTALPTARWLEIHSAGTTESRRPALCANSLPGSDFAPHHAPGADLISRPPCRNFDTYSRGAA